MQTKQSQLQTIYYPESKIFDQQVIKIFINRT